MNSTSPRRVPLSPSTQPPQVKPQMNTAAIAAYNSWYQTMNSEWAWLIYTVIAIFLLIGGVYVYNKFIYPPISNGNENFIGSLEKIQPT